MRIHTIIQDPFLKRPGHFCLLLWASRGEKKKGPKGLYWGFFKGEAQKWNHQFCLL